MNRSGSERSKIIRIILRVWHVVERFPGYPISKLVILL